MAQVLQARPSIAQRREELADILMLVGAILVSFLLLELALIHGNGTEFSQDWKPVTSNVDKLLALKEMQR